MKTLKELKYEEMKNLLEELLKREPTKDKGVIPMRAEMFFPTMNAMEELEFMNVCESILNEANDGEGLFNLFKESHPDIEIDESGKTPKTKKNYWEIGLYSLDMAAEEAKKRIENNCEKTQIDRDVLDAKNLDCLFNYGKAKINYFINKTMFEKKFGALYTEKISKAEMTLEKFGLSKETLNRAMSYMLEKKTQPRHQFFKNFLSRFEYLEKDPELKNTSNKEFYELLKKMEA